jgi:hypothetical protein
MVQFLIELHVSMVLLFLWHVKIATTDTNEGARKYSPIVNTNGIL